MHKRHTEQERQQPAQLLLGQPLGRQPAEQAQHRTHAAPSHAPPRATRRLRPAARTAQHRRPAQRRTRCAVGGGRRSTQ